MNMYCPKCNNSIRFRKIKSTKTGPLCTPLFEQVEYCEYCEWKGTTGMGKQLRDVIKEISRNAEIQRYGLHQD